MKNIYWLILVMLVLYSRAFSQNLSAKTNELHLNFSDAGLPNTTHLPSVVWIRPKLEHTNSQESRFEIKADIASVNPLAEVKLMITNKTTGNTQSKIFGAAANTNSFSIYQNITVTDGINFLEIVVTDNKGGVVSSIRNIAVGGDALADAVALDRKDYVLLFLTDKYDHWDDLVNPVDDGHSIANELKDKYGFEVEVVENPTVEMVWEKLRSYSERKFKPQDQLMIFFAGHGHFDETFGEGYVVARNSLKNDPSRNTYISHNRLRGVINNIQSEHILLMMDVCFGGTLDPVIARARSAEYNATPSEMLIRKLGKKTRKYLTSGGKEYVSDGVPGKHSPFASKFIESLRTFGGDDRILTLNEVQTNLEKLKQAPRFGSFGEDDPISDFVFVAK